MKNKTYNNQDGNRNIHDSYYDEDHSDTLICGPSRQIIQLHRAFNDAIHEARHRYARMRQSAFAFPVFNMLVLALVLFLGGSAADLSNQWLTSAVVVVNIGLVAFGLFQYKRMNRALDYLDEILATKDSWEPDLKAPLDVQKMRKKN